MENQEPKIIEVNGTKVEAGSQAYWVEKGIEEELQRKERIKNKFQEFKANYKLGFAHNLSDEDMHRIEEENEALLNELEGMLDNLK